MLSAFIYVFRPCSVYIGMFIYPDFPVCFLFINLKRGEWKERNKERNGERNREGKRKGGKGGKEMSQGKEGKGRRGEGGEV